MVRHGMPCDATEYRPYTCVNMNKTHRYLPGQQITWPGLLLRVLDVTVKGVSRETKNPFPGYVPSKHPLSKRPQVRFFFPQDPQNMSTNHPTLTK